MNMLNKNVAFFIGLLMLFGQQAVFAEIRPHSHRAAPVKRLHTTSPRKHQTEHRYYDRRHDHGGPTPVYRNYYKPGYRVRPLPYGSSRIYFNAAEYFFFDGYFYLPSGTGYVIVEAPIGAIVGRLPQLHHIVHWYGEPYYVVGNTYYRRHPRGYIVVPDPSYGYRR